MVSLGLLQDAATVDFCGRACHGKPLMEEFPTPSPEEAAAEEAAQAAAGDWGPVFVYGSLLSERAWGSLLGRVPEMQAAILRGFERRVVQCAGFAALVERDQGLVVGKLISGLRPAERRLMDSVVDDGFSLVDATVNYVVDLDAAGQVECTTYVWRTEFEEALGDADWEYDLFCRDYLEDFDALCTDMRVSHEAEGLSDADLKEVSLRRRRQQ